MGKLAVFYLVSFLAGEVHLLPPGPLQLCLLKMIRFFQPEKEIQGSRGMAKTVTAYCSKELLFQLTFLINVQYCPLSLFSGRQEAGSNSE